MKVIRDKRKFYLEVFNPVHEKKFLGRILTLQAGGEDVEVFVTHFKKPNTHFYIKGQGYPVNNDLLLALKNANVKFIMIPEEGKQDFRCYLTKIENYFSDSRLVAEEKAEPQRVIPCMEMKSLKMDKEILRRGVYF